MIGNGKATASLSSSLLARKGQARPAMRPQGFVGLSSATAQDDLGWNDMGDETPAAPVTAPKPVVLRQREALDARVVAPAPQPQSQPKPQPQAQPQPRPAAIRAPREAAVGKAKAAFTLRLDTQRHLRLRLASAVTNRSAQQLVTEALDAFLESLTEVEALARQVGPGKDHG